MAKKKYWLINVAGEDGYSMVVHTSAKSIEEAIDIAAAADLFDFKDDARGAFGEEADKDTVKHFAKWGCINEL